MELTNKGLALTESYSINEDGSFVVRRMDAKQVPAYGEGPCGQSELLEYYRGVRNGQVKQIEKEGFALLSSEQVEIEGMIGYQVVFGSETGKVGEVLFFLIEDVLYVLSYQKMLAFSETAKRTFFDSARINQRESRSQTQASPCHQASLSRSGEVLGRWIANALMAIGAIIGLIFLIKRIRN
ncbi:MAG: hypothetical protein AAF399_25650 [Bacteroidota bacterium]